MDSGEELLGARGSHVWSLPTAHASRSFSAGGATSACLTPLMLFSLAAPLLFTSESCFWVPPAMGVSHHPRRMPCQPSRITAPPPPPRCSSAGNAHLPPVGPVPHALTPANTHTLLAASHLWRGTRSFAQVPSTHLRVTRLPEHSPSPPPGEGSGRPHCLGAWQPPALCWVRVTRRPRPPQTQGSRGTSWHPRS